MSRATSIRIFALVILVPLAAFAGKPNIIIFCSDDQPKDGFGFNSEEYLTPAMDRLRNEGLYFPNHHTTSTVCSPSRYTSLCGRYASRDPRWQPVDNGHLFMLFGTNIGRGETSIVTELNKLGYVTGFTGKADGYSGKEGPEYRRLKKLLENGDISVIPELQEAKADLIRSIQAETGVDYVGGMFPGNLGNSKSPFATHNQDYITAANLEFIDRARASGKPFFLWTASTLIHTPGALHSMEVNPERRYLPDNLLKDPLNVQPGNDSIFQRLDALGIRSEKSAGILWLDDSVQAMLDKLEKDNLLENTIFVYLSDHSGYGGKGTTYQIGCNVPLMMYWKGHTENLPDAEVNVTNADIVPTLLDLVGADVDAYGADGRSLAELFRGKTIADLPIYIEMGNTRAVRIGDWKYIAWRFEEDVLKNLPIGYQQEGLHTRNPGNQYVPMIADSVNRQPAYRDADQLYNLSTDPEEMNNLARNPEYKDRLIEMKQLMARTLLPLRGSFGDFKYEAEINRKDVIHPVALEGDLDLSAPFNVISVSRKSRLTESSYTVIRYNGKLIGRFEDDSRVRESGYKVDYSEKGEIRLIK